MDDLDRAKEYEMKDRDIAIDAVVNRAPPPAPKHNADGQRICLDCNELIPAARLNAFPDAARCIDCKADLEHKQKGYL